MKNIKRVLSFVMVALFIIIPVSAKAQLQNDYEQEFQQFSNEELAQMLAPIALYPDALLSQVLIAASYPYEVAEADRWLARNPDLTDEQLEEALQEKEWDVSILSLCYYPKVINMMTENLTWTAKLGDAFVYQQKDVMDKIQDLRSRAAAQGNLNTTDEQKVIVEERIIRIEPAYASYLYVPVYDPLVIYGPWWYPAFPPFRVFYPGVIFAGPRIVFSPGIFLSFGVIGWSHFDWHAHHIIIRDVYRTKRFNRHYDSYHKPNQHVYWKPNDHKREMRDRRRYEYPRHRSTGQPSLSAPKRGSDTIAPPRRKGSPQPVMKPQTHPTRPQVQPSVEPQARPAKPQRQPAVRQRIQPAKTHTQTVAKPEIKPIAPQARPEFKPRKQPTSPQQIPVMPQVSPKNKPQIHPVQPQPPHAVNGGRISSQDNGSKGVINQSPTSSMGSRGGGIAVQENGRGKQQSSPGGQRGNNSAQNGRDFRK